MRTFELTNPKVSISPRFHEAFLLRFFRQAMKGQDHFYGGIFPL